MSDEFDPQDTRDTQEPSDEPPRFDPLRELSRFGESVGKVIEQGIQQVQILTNPVGYVRLDIYELDDNIVIRTSPLDNLIPSSIEVSMEENVLTISGTTKPDNTPAHASFLLQERKFGDFSRSVAINIPVRSQEAKAKLKNGSLTITLPIDTDHYQDIDVVMPEE